jgi:hypothetical protein
MSTRHLLHLRNSLPNSSSVPTGESMLASFAACPRSQWQLYVVSLDTGCNFVGDLHHDKRTGGPGSRPLVGCEPGLQIEWLRSETCLFDLITLESLALVLIETLALTPTRKLFAGRKSARHRPSLPRARPEALAFQCRRSQRQHPSTSSDRSHTRGRAVRRCSRPRRGC